MKSNFLVIGAMKCGTTSLCSLLSQHPDIFMCSPKETYFFSNDEVYKRGMKWYESLFKNCEGKIAIGEGSTNYTKKILYPKTIYRIVKHLPDVRLIYIVRHPIEQIESNWMHCRVAGFDSLSFARAIKENSAYINIANYLLQINVYREHFPDNKILIIFFEDFKVSTNTVMKKCFRFLHVNPMFVVKEDEKHQNVFTERYGDRKILSITRQIPIMDGVFQKTPSFVRNAFRPILKWRMNTRPKWNNDLLNWVADQLGSEMEGFLKHCGKPKDFWDLNLNFLDETN